MKSEQIMKNEGMKVAPRARKDEQNMNIRIENIKRDHTVEQHLWAIPALLTLHFFSYSNFIGPQ